MSEIMLGVLRMPQSCWSGDEIDTAQRHAAYCEAADLIEELTIDRDCQRHEIERLREEIRCSRPPTVEIERRPLTTDDLAPPKPETPHPPAPRHRT